jgi:hypothetical protein
MAQSFEQMSDLDQGIYFRQACDVANSHAFTRADRDTVASAFRIFGVEAPGQAVNSAMHALDYQQNGLPRPVEGPRSNTAEYFTRAD